MSKIMLVNVTHVEESRVAILEDGILAQYEIETLNRTNIKGNIHNAVVENVHPSLEAAFLKIGPDLKGFLPLDEVNFRLLPSRGEAKGRGKIGQHLHPGQKLLVQVVREPFSGKPPTVSTYFSLPGRFLVLMPGVDSAGISRKIADSDQRDRLKKIVDELKAPEGFGIIVRTAGVGQTKTELQRDLRYLLRLWESIQRGSRDSDFPALVYRERDLVIRTIRDYLTPDVSEVWIDSEETHARALEFMRDIMPTRAKLLKLHGGDRPLFSKFNLEEQIETIYKRSVQLPSGGEIVIDGTEALTAIDVNSARSSRQGDAEERALQTNLEAASEIARQLRLRDLGGLIVVDFIDMAATRNQKKVEKAMRDAMRSDRAKYDVTRISKLGLMELTRQRLRGEKLAATYSSCPACEGYGLIKTVEAAGLAALRKLQMRVVRGKAGRIRVKLPIEVAAWTLNHKRDDLSQLERRHDVRIHIEANAAMLRHESEFEFSARERTEEPPPAIGYRAPLPTPPDLREVEALAGGTETASPAEEAASDPAVPAAPARKRRRRRRRTKGADDAEPAAPVEAAAESEAETPEPEGEGPDRGETAENGDDAARKRKRRRRRRRGRGTQGATPEGEAGPPSDDEQAVPAGVRSEELMPAATGGRSGRRSSRRRRSGRASQANSGGGAG